MTFLSEQYQYLRITQLNTPASVSEQRQLILQALGNSPHVRFSCKLRRNKILPQLQMHAAAFTTDTPGYDFYQHLATAVPPAGSFHFLFLKSVKSETYGAYNLLYILNNEIHSVTYQGVILPWRCFVPQDKFYQGLIYLIISGV